jgi:DivIVA domain-containing protein
MPRRKKENADALSGFAAPELEPASRSRLTPEDVQKKEFRLAFRGYNEGDVDEFLDQVTEDLAVLHEENKRLQEQLGEPLGGPIDLQAAEERAERIVREAREHAARLVADAERRAGGNTGEGGGSAPPGWYLLQERGFLERLASLVKEHAEDLKQQARSRPENHAGSGEGSGEVPAPVPVAQPAPDEVSLAEGADSEGSEGAPNEEEDKPGEDRVDLTELESTAPMSSVAAPEEHDLLRDWDERSPELERHRRKDEDPSLKELFWGEDA